MFGLETLDVTIGLITVYLMFSLAVTALVEAIGSIFDLRAGNLKTALTELLKGTTADNEAFVTAFYAHPLVKTLSKDSDARPSYIPKEIVSRVIESILLADGAKATLDTAIASLPGDQDNQFKRLLQTLEAEAKGDLDAFRAALERQFDAVMDRANGWFKRKIQWITFGIALALVSAVNIDSIDIATKLISSPQARAKMLEVAGQALAEQQAALDESKAAADGQTVESGDAIDPVTVALTNAKAAQDVYDQAVADMKAAGLPIGWQEWKFNEKNPCLQVLRKLVGLALTVFAVCLGAPFWFDLLSKFMQIRAAGVSPDEKKPK